MCYQIEIEPRDVMYFRDGKPIGGSGDGFGATWPLPSIFHSAMLSKLNAQLGEEVKEWEGKHNRREKDPKNVRFNFGGLKTWGPFPNIGTDIYLPTPADLLPSEKPGQSEANGVLKTGGCMTPVQITSGANNLPAPLKHSVASTQPPSKQSIGEWMKLSEYQKYLTGKTQGLETIQSSALYSSEARPGIAMDAQTGTTEDGKFYSAEYLRLNQGVSMTAFAECEAKGYQSPTGKDVFAELFASKDNSAFIFGGQRGVAWLENKREKSTQPMKLDVQQTEVNVKWSLISPAYFNLGWLPGWIDPETGEVKLKEKIERGNLPRREWREKLQTAPFIGGKLVAARIPKPIVVSGWELDVENNTNGEPKATKLYAPPGAVYYFTCTNKEEAKKLITALHGQTKSDLLGEHGFGLGLCSSWNLETNLTQTPKGN